jgi:hypothetical protein
MKTLCRKPSAARSTSYGLVLFVISAAGFFQAPSLLGREQQMNLLLVSLTRAGILSASGGKAALSAGLQAGEDHHVHIPYFAESEDLDSTLTLNNNMPQAMTATVTLFSKDGQALVIPPMSLEPLLPVRLSLSELAERGRGDFSSGSIEIFFHGPSMAVTSQVSIISTAKRLNFESVESEAMDYASNKLDGIVWLPDEQTHAKLALTNTTAGELSVIGSTNRSEVGTRTFTLESRETRIVDIDEAFGGIKGAGASALVSLEHSGSPGDLIVSGFAINEETGFSTNLVFSDRATAVSTHLAGAHVRFGKATTTEGFAPGTTFRAPLVMANAGNQANKASIYVDYTVGAVPGRVTLGQMNLGPKQLKTIDVAAEMAKRGVAGPVDDAGIDISYNGAPGSVMARLVSLDQTGDLSYDVPVKDPLAGGSTRATGSYPWRLDAGFTTVVHLKNTLNKPVEGIVQVRYEGGNYNPERIKMGPYQTVAVDIGQLRDAQQKDIRGGIMPEGVSSGQVKWLEIEPGSLIGRAEVANVREGIASSFSCSGSGCGASYSTSSVSPSSLSGLAGNTASVTAQEMDKDNNGTPYGPYDKTGVAMWTSSDTSVATVSSGSVTFASAGTCSISASWSATVYVGPNCSTQTVSAGGGAGATVAPQITNISPSSLCTGTVADVTITGRGFGTNPSVSAGSNITVTINSNFTTDTNIDATFTVAGNGAGGNQTVTVTSRGQSATVNFYLQIPTSLSHTAVDTLHSCTNCTIGPNPNQCGAYRLDGWTLMDQQSPRQRIVTSSASITEYVTGDNTYTKNYPLIDGNIGDFYGFSTNAPACPGSFTLHMTQTYKAFVGLNQYTFTTQNALTYQSDGNGNYAIAVTTTTP